MKVRLKILALLIIIPAFSCRYSFTGASVPPHLKTIAIPVFEDKSGFGQAIVREELTNKLVQRFIEDNTLKIADKKSADSILEGEIISIYDRPVVVGGNEVVTRKRVSITVHVVYRDMVKHRKIWEKEFTNWGEYELNRGNIEQNRLEAISKAIDKLVEDIFLATVSNW